MANFNWFSRTFNRASKGEKPAEAVEKTDSKVDEKSAEAETTSEPGSSQDYLAWAKTAYQNIQKQQAKIADDSQDVPPTQDEAASAEEDTPVEPGETVLATPLELEIAEVSETDVETPGTPAVADVSTEEPVEQSAEGVARESENMPPVVPVLTDADRVFSPPSETSAPTGPAWMQAAAERKARLERLQETAIAEPEPEPEAVTIPSASLAPEAVLPDIDFDEAFLWSAEVLAAQGRQATEVSLEEITWLNRLRQGLDKTRRGLVNQLKAIVGQGPLNEEAVFEIEALLLQADVGVEATDAIIEALQNRLREETLPPEQAIAYLKKILRDMLDAPLGESHNLTFVPEKDQLNIWLLTGVNGAGKTTTIGKLAHIAKKSDYHCLIGAADTFRAAAVEQVKAWGARSGVEVVANPGKNTDPAAVVFDAISAAQSRETELLLIDTAGRLQNKKNLMAELAKIRRIIDKKAPGARVESLLVLDATLGQNGLRQAEVFSEAANLSGVVLTKLDGTAKGGVALAVVQQLGLPIRFIGAGEGIEDLRPFSSYEFVEALISS